MINRVFCYSDEEAKKNGNSISIGKMILQVIGMVVLILVAMFIGFAINDNFLDDMTSFLIVVFGFSAIVIGYAIKTGFKMGAKLMGFAIDTDNNVYCVTKLNNGEDFVIGGMAAGKIIDTILKESNSLAGDIVEGAGTAMAMYSLDKATEIMQNPEIIAKMVEYANTTTGAEVKQILKVYNYTQNSHSVKIRCDYRKMRTAKMQYNKKITIYKSYNCFNDLMETILNNRGN